MEEIICNIDEVGRGCLFSNVTCCACIIKEFQDDTYKQIKDSKKLSKIKRNKLEKYKSTFGWPPFLRFGVGVQKAKLFQSGPYHF